MKKVEKQYVQKQISDIFGINVEFFTKKAQAVGYCAPWEDAKTIFISTSRGDADTIAHEIAHIKQYERIGETFCYESATRKERNEKSEIIKEHSLLTKEIIEMMDKKKINAQFGLFYCN
jgi:hypothetical protein